MTPLFSARRLLAGLALAVAVPAVAASAWPPAVEAPATASAVEVIRAAMAQRVGDLAEITVTALEMASEATAYRQAIPDPSGMLGRPIRFTLITAAGVAVGAVVSVRVVVEHAVAQRAIPRGQSVIAGDLEAVRHEVKGVPIKRLPTVNQMLGARVLRPIALGAIVLPGFVAVRRAIEPGDRITVTAVSGLVEVSATFEAADGGQVGDVIRVRNPETKKFLRGRIVNAGMVEVLHGR